MRQDFQFLCDRHQPRPQGILSFTGAVLTDAVRYTKRDSRPWDINYTKFYNFQLNTKDLITVGLFNVIAIYPRHQGFCLFVMREDDEK